MDYSDYKGAAKPYYAEISILQKSIFSPLFSSAHKNRPFELPALSDDLLDLPLFWRTEKRGDQRVEPTPRWGRCL